MQLRGLSISPFCSTPTASVGLYNLLVQKNNSSEHQPIILLKATSGSDPFKGIEVRLFSNRFCILFQDDASKGQPAYSIYPETKELYLVQDLKDVDYIIKIDSGVEADSLMIERMESIDQISYRYSIDQSRLNIDLSLNLY